MADEGEEGEEEEEKRLVDLRRLSLMASPQVKTKILQSLGWGLIHKKKM